MCICANSRSFCQALWPGLLLKLACLGSKALPASRSHTPRASRLSIWCVKRSLLASLRGIFLERWKPEKTWQFFLGNSGNSFDLVCLLFFLAVSGNRATPLREHDLGFSALHDLDQSDAVIPVYCERFERQAIRRSLIQIHLVHFDGLQGSARCCKLAF